jgi:sugar lactone lactonase YvrE
MTTDAVIPANPTVCELGEGPVWDPVRERILWLDIRRGLVFTGRLESDGTVALEDQTAFAGTVGAIAVSADGSWIVAAKHTLILHPPGGPDRELARVIDDSAPRRTNDGKPDPAGRFLIGTLALGDDSDREVLVRLEDDGRLTGIDSDLGLSNGLAWSADGRTMYSIDTARRTVFAREYDPESGEVGPRRAHIVMTDGFPDGMCIDAEGHLWIAIWGGAEVRRYRPDGTLDRAIAVPAPHVTSVAFAGPELRTLVITTATQDLTDEQLTRHPLSGRLFTTEPGVRGLPVPLWRGTPDLTTASNGAIA